MKKSGFKRPIYDPANPPKVKPRKPLAKVSKKKVKKPKIKSLKKKLDEVFSKYIRQKYADMHGDCLCFTCGKKSPWQALQCGHFISRSYLATRFSEDNCRVQCWGCNGFGGGRLVEFANKLEKETPGITTILYKKAQEITKDFPYQEMILKYTNLLNEISSI